MYVWLGYAVLAVAALGLSWRNVELRPVGIALFASWALSNLATSYLSIMERPAAYTVCEVLVLSMAFLAHVCGASRIMIAVVAVSILSITFNICMTLVDHATREQILLWQVSSNLCFAAECLFVLTTIAYERVRNRPPARPLDRGVCVALHGGAPAPSETDR